MVDIKYANAYKEVLVVLNNLTKDDYNKIPKEYIDFLKNNCNEKYEFNYDVSKSLSNQNLLEDTKYILFGLFEKFGATEIQKAKIKAFKNNYNQKLEKEKIEKYNPNNIFKKDIKDEKKINDEILLTKSLTQVKELTFFQNVIQKIKNFLKFN